LACLSNIVGSCWNTLFSGWVNAFFLLFLYQPKLFFFSKAKGFGWP
jgi:hypothetical protein